MNLSLIPTLCLACLCAFSGAQPTPPNIANWKREYGNHRAKVQVGVIADAVRVHLDWRRRDSQPENKQILVFDAATGQQIHNVALLAANRESGDIAFQPDMSPGSYYIYYMPFKTTGSPYFPTVTYPAPIDAASPTWLAAYHLLPSDLTTGQWKALPETKAVQFQSRTAFDNPDPMEQIATQEEVDKLLDTHSSDPYLLFPEDRLHPIRMTEDIPKRWVEKGPSKRFAASVKRGEFFVFQVGLMATRATLDDLKVSFWPLSGPNGDTIPASAFRCFNQGGTDWLGRAFTKRIDVPKGQVAPLWMGVQIPKNLKPGTYHEAIAIESRQTVPGILFVNLTVQPEQAKNHGDDDLANLSRLRWLDSKIGLDNQTVAPYTPLQEKDSTIGCLQRSVRFGQDGLPTSIVSKGHEILSNPIALVVQSNGKTLKWQSGKPRNLLKAPAAITTQTNSKAGQLTLQCVSKMEDDGYLNYRLTLKANAETSVDDIRLEIPYRKAIATYLMGMGKEGGYRPKEWSWNWNDHDANNMIWLGTVEAGLQCRLKDVEDSWELFHLAHLPDAWCNGGKGNCTVKEQGRDTVLLTASGGARKLKAGQTLHFNFGLLITPVKPLDQAHWSWRYDHEFVQPEQAKKNEATIINIHQGNELNPYINYPFIKAAQLKAYVKKAHALGMKVKIYYTVRELSNRVVEMWALRGLGYEIFTDGPGGGDSWLQEHLVSHYKPAWHNPLPDGTIDAAIATVGLSRWHNYYLEGLRWLIDNVGIDGLYLDGIGYDREIMKRVRKVMDNTRRGCLIDFHSGNSFAPEYGKNSVANQYMDHFPYISSLWFGEGFDYNRSPDYWLTEISGIPYGLYGEMLEGNGNPWRGMIYGMTARYYGGADPKYIWRLWDQFGIAKAKMEGYWSPTCPVHTDNPDVLATAYVQDGKTLISIASWAKQQVDVRLKIDWKAIGLHPNQATLTAPGIKNFQAAATFKANDKITVEPGHGWLLILSNH